jgi:hypothetical protein
MFGLATLLTKFRNFLNSPLVNSFAYFCARSSVWQVITKKLKPSASYMPRRTLCIAVCFRAYKISNEINS